MASDPLDALRLSLMQDVLPVGLAVVERARRGGAKEVLAAFEGGSADPLDRLRQEGEPAASQLRDTLDRLQPGLGNPVMKVEVREEPATAEADPLVVSTTTTSTAADDPTDLDELHRMLTRISERLAELERRLG
ncbi:MAG: hypothetical protein VKN15_06270 [Cyanobacteriota bacterium]|nr:hypothetical protein [Cyanobacteriota bacterium]